MLSRIAIIAQNTLAALGLASLIEEMMPTGDVSIYNSLKSLAKDTGAGYNANEDPFVHYFISAQTLLKHARFFLPRRQKTIVLVQGPKATTLPEGFMQIDVSLPREGLLRALMTLHSHGHGPEGVHPYPIRTSDKSPHTPKNVKSLLTRRETDVLRQLVRGSSNKEAADALGVGLSTVITHRNNLTSKLGTRSLAALTVYAVSHGIVGVEEI